MTHLHPYKMQIDVRVVRYLSGPANTILVREREAFAWPDTCSSAFQQTFLTIVVWIRLLRYDSIRRRRRTTSSIASENSPRRGPVDGTPIGKPYTHAPSAAKMLDRLIGGGTPQKSGHMFVRIAHTELTASRTCPDSNETLLLLPSFRFIKVTRKLIKN
jgi:hypothetical protein